MYSAVAALALALPAAQALAIEKRAAITVSGTLYHISTFDRFYLFTHERARTDMLS